MNISIIIRIFKYPANRILKMFVIAILFIFQIGCASYSHLYSEYQEVLHKNPTRAENLSNRTVIFFLIDGLSYGVLQEQLQVNQLPHIKKFFLDASGGNIGKARTGFPSLTFPSVASLIMERPVEKHGVYGNKIFADRAMIDFELPASSVFLNKISKDRNIYARLKNKGFRTVNVDYNFSADADVSMKADDSEVGVSILKKKYEVIDKKLIGSLDRLLDKTATEDWPEFVFIHLVGLDFKSHDFGSKSNEAIEYLQFLDKKLGDLFRTLDAAEKRDGRQIIGLLSSDHGFDQDVESVLNLEDVLHSYEDEIQILNEGRYLGIFFPKDWTLSKKEVLLNDLVLHPKIDVIAFDNHETLHIQSSINKVQIHLKDTFDEKYQKQFYPYFVSNLGHYFSLQGHPDALIIPRSGVALRADYLGHHGGPTEREMIVPLLLHNAKLEDGNTPPALWELLNFID